MTLRREPAIDILRGIALVGILLVNVQVFSGHWSPMELTQPSNPVLHDRVSDFLVNWLVHGKFYPIFSFLFGWGAFVMASAGPEFRSRYRLRLLGLFLLGVAHTMLLFEGDILVVYSILGLFVLRAIGKDISSELLVRRARCLFVIGTLMLALFGAAILLIVQGFAGTPEGAAAIRAAMGTARDVSFVRLLETRAITLACTPLSLIVYGPIVLAMFYLGVAAARTFAAAGLASAQPLARRLLPWTLAPALVVIGAGALAGAVPELVSPVASSIGKFLATTLLGWWLAIGYLCLAALVLPGTLAVRLSGTLGAAGRMSLSVYIAQSAVMGLLFYGYGLGLYGRLGSAMAALTAIAVWAALVLLAMAWLRHFRIGPLEWVLRSISEGRLVGLKARSTSPLVAAE